MVVCPTLSTSLFSRLKYTSPRGFSVTDSRNKSWCRDIAQRVAPTRSANGEYTSYSETLSRQISISNLAYSECPRCRRPYFLGSDGSARITDANTTAHDVCYDGIRLRRLTSPISPDQTNKVGQTVVWCGDSHLTFHADGAGEPLVSATTPEPADHQVGPSRDRGEYGYDLNNRLTSGQARQRRDPAAVPPPGIGPDATNVRFGPLPRRQARRSVLEMQSDGGLRTSWRRWWHTDRRPMAHAAGDSRA